MSLVFLDFDGVLNPSMHKNFLRDRYKTSEYTIRSKDRHGYLFDPYCVGNLKKLIGHTGADIVVCSSWRLHVDLQLMWEERNLPGRMIGQTPTLSTEKDGVRKMDNAFHLRGFEVNRWLGENGKQNYVIIDDHPEIYNDEHKPRLVACNKLFGFTREDMHKAVKILSNTEWVG